METASTSKNNSLDNLSLEDKQKLTGFFELLIKVDKRINPSFYKKVIN